MSVSVEKLVIDAKRMANRLKDRAALSDSLIGEAESINEHLKTLRQVQDNFDALNELARNSTNYQLINAINDEDPHIREMQLENRELRACLQDHQRALEHIMSKYREHTQKKILNTKFTFTLNDFNRERHIYEKNLQQQEKIQEMAAVMRQASCIDEEQVNKEMEYLTKLVVENKGLRELLQISQTNGGSVQKFEDKSIQTDLDIIEPSSTSMEDHKVQ